jgi:hypothetical protein
MTERKTRAKTTATTQAGPSLRSNDRKKNKGKDNSNYRSRSFAALEMTERKTKAKTTATTEAGPSLRSG